ncbi:hypothetical protein PTKIN_Ptkin14bG0102900 [Pterospermum kingtungense]
MKALFLIVSILLGSSLFIHTFTMARELAEKERSVYALGPASTEITPGRPDKRVVPCRRGMPYRSCKPLPIPPPRRNCSPHYSRSCNNPPAAKP